MWGVMIDGSNAVSYYPIIGFTNYGGPARLRVWDNDIGWVDLVTPVNYNSWTRFSIELMPDTSVRFYVNNVLVYTETSTSSSVAFSAAIMQAYNFADPLITGATPNAYTANWANSVLVVDTDGQADEMNCSATTSAFSTISSAVSAAAPSDTVLVCPGTYNENPSISKSLNLQSTGGRNVTTIQLPTSNGNYPYGSMELSGPNNNITVDGFTVRGNDGTGSLIGNTNIMLGNTGGMLANSNVVLQNNRLLVGKVDFVLDYSDSMGVLTTYTLTQAEYMTSFTMTNNIIENLGSGQAQRPYYVNPGIRNFTFQNNQINGNFQRLAVSEADTTVLTGNDFAGTNPSSGFGLNDGGSATYVGSTVTNNLVSNAGRGLYIGTYSGSVNATVNGNAFVNNLVGIEIPFATTGNTINFNRIVGNSLAGINTFASGPLNAENNWWGCNYGPNATGAGCAGTTNGIAGAGAGSVDSTPYLKLTTTAATPSVVVGGPDLVTSLLTTNSDNNTPGGGFVRNGTPATFATSLAGSAVAPPSSTTASGSTSTSFSSPNPGVSNVSTTIDGQTVSTSIAVYPAACAALSMPALTSLTGQPITVPVNTDEMTARGALSADFTITYNPSVLTTSLTGDANNWGVTLGSVGTSNGGGRTLTVTRPSAGTLVISVFGTEEFQGTGSLVDLNFNVIGLPATTSPMVFSSFTYNEGTPCVTTSNGLVTVLSGTITGEVTYGNAIVGGGPSPRHVPGTTLNAVGSITPVKTGDDQSALTGFDSACIAQYVVNQAGGCMTSPGFPTAAQTTVADVSGNSTITSFDAALISRYAASLPGFGNTGQWRFTPTTRSYLTVNTNQTGQNYVALLMGDVTGNWINGLATRPAPIFPEGERPMRISAPSISAPVGTEVSIPIDVQDTTGRGILSYEFDLTFDPTVLEPAANTVDLTGTIGEGQTVTVNALERGKIRVVVYGTNVLAGEGHLLNLKFNVVGDVDESSDLTWTTFNINEGGINFETKNGRVVVRAASNDAAIAGRVLSAAGQPVSGATVTLVDTTGQTRTARTSSLGNFRFAELTVGQTYTVSVSAKRYTFAPQTVSVTGDAVNLDLIAEQ
jgi:hypothetical protein